MPGMSFTEPPTGFQPPALLRPEIRAEFTDGVSGITGEEPLCLVLSCGLQERAVRALAPCIASDS